MNSILIVVTTLLIGTSFTKADVSHIFNQYETATATTPTTTTTTTAGPPIPYAFSYSAGRAPGHIDRMHTEVSDGSGVVRGKFAYVDPRNQVRSVEYTADQYGFHPELSHQVEDTEANKRATQKHFELYNRIAEEHANPQLIREESEPVEPPQQSAAVIRATNRHLSLFKKIAQQHAEIGAEHEALRMAFEATSELNELAEQPYYEQ